MDIPTQALSSRHRACGLQLTQIGDYDMALYGKDGMLVKVFHNDAGVLDIWDVADEYLLLKGTVEKQVYAARYDGLQSILDAALGEYRSKGFSLEMRAGCGEALALRHWGEDIATLVGDDACITNVHRECLKHLSIRE